jgi:hypothetical protein
MRLNFLSLYENRKINSDGPKSCGYLANMALRLSPYLIRAPGKGECIIGALSGLSKLMVALTLSQLLKVYPPSSYQNYPNYI